jgi:hypothetical protein
MGAALIRAPLASELCSAATACICVCICGGNRGTSSR